MKLSLFGKEKNISEKNLKVGGPIAKVIYAN